MPDFKEERTQKFTTIILTVVALSIFGLFAINPTVSTILKLRRELEDNKIVDNKLQGKIQNISTLQKKYVALQGDLPTILSAVPQSPDVPLLAAQIQSIAKSSDVSIENFQTFEVDVQNKVKPGGYSSFEFALSAGGSYNNLYKFMTSLSNMQRIVSIELLTLGRKTGSDQLLLSLKSKAFFSQ